MSAPDEPLLPYDRLETVEPEHIPSSSRFARKIAEAFYPRQPRPSRVWSLLKSGALDESIEILKTIPVEKRRIHIRQLLLKHDFIVWHLERIAEIIFWTLREGDIYRNRQDKTVSAVDFLRSEYSKELEDGSITLSDLRRLDEGLWRALRNWAHHGGHELTDVIPIGRTTPGAPLKDQHIDPDALDSSDPVQALALRVINQRRLSRESARRRRAKTPTL